MAGDGVRVPPARDLPRRAIIGVVAVAGIVSSSESPWFGGAMGLVLTDAVACAPIAAPGEPGYFTWRPHGEVAATVPWMMRHDRAGGGEGEPSLFPDLGPTHRAPPPKPWGPRE